jgi:small subunit ribosomal protein S19
MVRSIWKGPFCELYKFWKTNMIDREFKNTNQKSSLKKMQTTKVWSRRSMVLPEFIGYNFLIYNGKTFISLTISEEMIGHKFGEFANTRKKPIHKKKIQTKKRK